MDVKIKDRKEEIEHLRLAFNIAGVNVEYLTVDLIVRIQEKLNQLKGKFTLEDGVSIQHDWRKDWDNYFKEQSKAKDA